jgi:maltose alpha-D-glucosyltransferase/alpha-amylase
MPLLIREDGSVRDALEDVGRLWVLGRALAHGETLKGTDGVFRFGGPGLDPLSPPGASSVRVMGAEQSNSSIVFDDAVILKLIRRVEEGDNPELELNRFLTNEGFEFIPAQVGEIFYETESDGAIVNIDLGIAQTFIGDATEGWSEALKHIAAMYDSISGSEDPKTRMQRVDSLCATLLEEIESLGEVTASMHVVFGRGEEGNPEIGRESATPQDLSDAAIHARYQLQSLDLARDRSVDQSALGSAGGARRLGIEDPHSRRLSPRADVARPSRLAHLGLRGGAPAVPGGAPLLPVAPA